MADMKKKTMEEESGAGEEPPDEAEEIDTMNYLKEVTKTLALILIFGMGVYALVRIAYSADDNFLPDFIMYIFYPFQYSELYITYGISKLFGIDVAISTTQDFTLNYIINGRGEPIQIVSACTALCEMSLVATIILVFRGPKMKKRLIWAGIFAGVIYVENIIRLVMNYPLFHYLGEDGWQTYHNLWMAYGQLLVVMILLGIYAVFIANKEIVGVYRNKPVEKSDEDEGENDDDSDEDDTEDIDDEEQNYPKEELRKKNKTKNTKPKKGGKKNG